MDNDTFQHYALKYEHLIGEDRQVTAAIKEIIYLSENPQTETKSMSKEQAIEAMKSGAKVAHRYFSPHEWVTMEGNLTIITEEGYSVSTVEFWKYRHQEEWLTDWSIWSNPTETKVEDVQVGGFTGGEWEVWAELNVQSKTGRAICSCGVNNGNPQSRTENIANARLIANAPAMFKALQEVYDYVQGGANFTVSNQSIFYKEIKEILNNISNK